MVDVCLTQMNVDLCINVQEVRKDVVMVHVEEILRETIALRMFLLKGYVLLQVKL